MKLYLKLATSVMFWIFLVGIAIPWLLSINFTIFNYIGVALIVATPFLAVKNYKIIGGKNV